MKDKKKAFTVLKADSLREMIGKANYFFFGGGGQSNVCKQRWSRGHKARGQGQGHKKNPRPRPRTALPRTDPLEAKAGMLEANKVKDQGHRREWSQKKRGEKKVFKNLFQAISEEKVFKKILQAIYKILTIQKMVLSSSRGQGNFRGLEASRRRTSSRTPSL